MPGIIEHRFTHTHSLGLLALSAFDCLVIVLVWLEYRFLQSGVCESGK